MEDLDIIELIIDENNLEDGIEAISLVESPAIEENFVALSRHKVEFKSVDDEKRIVVGLALVPDKEIFRKSGDYAYKIMFSKETVKKASELYLKRLKNNNATIEHELTVKGVSLIESWIVEDPNMDKTNLYKLDAPEGAWAVVMKIDNDEIWEDVKQGKYLGFSIEGFFSQKEQELAKQDLVEYPHIMYNPKTGDEVEIMDEKEHDKYAAKGWVHSKPEGYKEQELRSYSDYPQSATNNAKRALAWVEKNGWGSCGTPVGKQRANQLANREPLTRDTISRMASFKRHQQHKDVPYSEGCGGLMWDCWGGTSGVEWAINKLEKLSLSEEDSQALEILNEILNKLKDE